MQMCWRQTWHGSWLSHMEAAVLVGTAATAAPLLPHHSQLVPAPPILRPILAHHSPLLHHMAAGLGQALRAARRASTRHTLDRTHTRSSSSSSSTSEGETAAPGAQASVCLPEGARAAAAQIAAATAAAAASAEPRQSTGGDEDCSSNSSSVGSGAGCGSVESKIRSSASGNAGALGDDGAGSSTSSNNFGNEAVLAIQAELEPHGPGSNVHAVGHGIPSLDGRADSGSNPLSRLLDVRPHISSLALTGSTCCWSREELASIAALRGITRLCGLSVTSLDITPLTNMASSLQHLEICLPDSPHPDEQDPSSYVAHAPANTVSSLMLLTHLDLWGYSGNPTHLLLQLASLPHLAHLSLFGLASAHAACIDDLALRALGLLPALTSFGADQIKITEASAEDALCLSQLTRLEVGQRVVSFLRLPRVFPNVQDVKLQWLWEQSMRKLAGWLSITSLSLSHLSYCVDWRLLRTLQSLRHLSLDACSSMSLLAQLLHLCADLPCLSCLSLSYWGVEMVEQRQQQQQQQRGQPGQQQGMGDTRQVPSWQPPSSQQDQQQHQQQYLRGASCASLQRLDSSGSSSSGQQQQQQPYQLPSFLSRDNPKRPSFMAATSPTQSQLPPHVQPSGLQGSPAFSLPSSTYQPAWMHETTQLHHQQQQPAWTHEGTQVQPHQQQPASSSSFSSILYPQPPLYPTPAPSTMTTTADATSFTLSQQQQQQQHEGQHRAQTTPGSNNGALQQPPISGPPFPLSPPPYPSTTTSLLPFQLQAQHPSAPSMSYSSTSLLPPFPGSTTSSQPFVSPAGGTNSAHQSSLYASRHGSSSSLL
mmetsp:Transcript_22274/g.58054  ORF Transcript_22274/g.58054 Transcript_22274/m.58054 type:complete len:819 (+) Transcript_22274:1093-3549(+)